MTKEEAVQCSFTILGAARSGIAAAKLLNKYGAKVLLYDSSAAEDLNLLNLEEMNSLGIKVKTGNPDDSIYNCDAIIKSPGIPPDNELVREASERKINVYSEVECASWFCKAPVIAITGTNGKTTTTVVTGEILKEAGYDVQVCGNVGLAFSEVADTITEGGYIVLEVSSFQLEDTESFKPFVSAVLNITEDHLDWHKTFENYISAKMKITKNQNSSDLYVYNHDDELLREKAKDLRIPKASFSLKENLEEAGEATGCYLRGDNIVYFTEGDKPSVIMNKNDMLIKGDHNVYNYLASVIMAKRSGVNDAVIQRTLSMFLGVEHRIEFVRELNGVKFYNDSKATNVDSMVMALKSFEENIILILGGKRGSSFFSDIMPLMKERVKKIIAIGETQPVIKEYFSGIIDTVLAGTMNDAVKKAYKYSKPGDTILLSPAYKSFDMFKDYEHRGREFKKAVLNLK